MNPEVAESIMKDMDDWCANTGRIFAELAGTLEQAFGNIQRVILYGIGLEAILNDTEPVETFSVCSPAYGCDNYSVLCRIAKKYPGTLLYNWLDSPACISVYEITDEMLDHDTNGLITSRIEDEKYLAVMEISSGKLDDGIDYE